MKDHLTRNPHRIDTFFTHTHLSSLVSGQTHTKWITLALWMGTTHGLQLECSMECDDMIWAGMFTGPVTMVTCCPLAVCHCWHWNNVSCCQFLRSSIIYLVISWMLHILFIKTGVRFLDSGTQAKSYDGPNNLINQSWKITHYKIRVDFHCIK